MNIKIFPLLLLLITCFSNSKSQGTWTQVSDFTPGNREITSWFQIGNFGYAAFGKLNNVYFNDLWQYDPVNDTWSQQASKPGFGPFAPGCFVIGDTAYFISGWNAGGQNVWTYIQSSNSWLQKNNFPGPPRYGPVSFAINGKGYMGTGYSPYMNDFWEYTPQTDSWVQITNVPGPVRQHATGVSVNGKGYAGLGFNGSSLNDWWEYDPVTSTWTQKTAFPGGGRRGTSYFEMNNKIYVSTGYNNASYYSDLWEYDPIADTWTQLTPNMPAAGRYGGFGFGFNDCMIIGTGSNGGVVSPNELHDVWRYCLPTINFGSTQQNLCPGTCTDFYSLTPNATSFQWYFPGGSPDTSTSANPTGICYSTSGSYNVTFIYTDTNGTDTLTIPNYITIFPSPSPQGIMQSGDTLIANAGSSSYQWYFNGNIINGATDYYYIAPASGNYNVVTTDTNGCEVEAVIYDVTAKTQELNGSSNLEALIYTNPFHTTTTIRLRAKSFSDNVSLEIFNSTGQSVARLYEGRLNPGETRDIEFNGSELTGGIYTYRITTSGQIISGRLSLIK